MREVIQGSGIYDQSAAVSTETRPKMIDQRLKELEGRMMDLSGLANRACIMLSGTSATPASLVNAALGKMESMGLYSDIFASLDRLNTLCADIEQSIQEAIR